MLGLLFEILFEINLVASIDEIFVYSMADFCHVDSNSLVNEIQLLSGSILFDWC